MRQGRRSKLAVVVHPGREDAVRYGLELVHRLERAGAELALPEDTADALGREDLQVPEEGLRDVTLVVGIGGDGTTLKAVHVARGTPVLAVNLGSMGFLSTAEPEEALGSVDKIVNGSYQVHERMGLEIVSVTGEAELYRDGEYPVAINEVSVEKSDPNRLVRIEVWVDDTRFTTYRADGVLVSTPTGSTAYALSVHGPLVDPELEAILVSPVAPHGLFDRVIVTPPTSVVTLAVGPERVAELSIDGKRWALLKPGARCVIGRSAEPVRFAFLRPPRPFLERVRSKFGLA